MTAIALEEIPEGIRLRGWLLTKMAQIPEGSCERSTFLGLDAVRLILKEFVALRKAGLLPPTVACVPDIVSEVTARVFLWREPVDGEAPLALPAPKPASVVAAKPRRRSPGGGTSRTPTRLGADSLHKPRPCKGCGKTVPNAYARGGPPRCDVCKAA